MTFKFHVCGCGYGYQRCFTPEKSLGSKTILLSYCNLFLSNLPFILVCSCMIIHMWRKRNIFNLL